MVAIGCEDGEIHVVNLLYDEELVHFTHKGNEGKIKSLSFSSDLTLGVSLLASISESPSDGQNIAFWDLNQKQFSTLLSAPHSGKQVSCLKFLSGEPVLISSSNDGNSIKMWLFEKGLLVPRLLRQRSGHVEPPNRIRFYGG